MKVVNLMNIHSMCLNVFGFRLKNKDDISSRSKGTANLLHPLLFWTWEALEKQEIPCYLPYARFVEHKPD